MAAMVATSLAIAGTASSSSSRPSTGVAFAGLKVRNRLTGLGCSPSVDEQFIEMRAVCMKARRTGSAAGGALACKASVADEIFRIVPIMSALVLVGIAIGFVLLRVEQAFEESEE